jgi:hypothetical protein
MSPRPASLATLSAGAEPAACVCRPARFWMSRLGSPVCSHSAGEFDELRLGTRPRGSRRLAWPDGPPWPRTSGGGMPDIRSPRRNASAARDREVLAGVPKRHGSAGRAALRNRQSVTTGLRQTLGAWAAAPSAFGASRASTLRRLPHLLNSMGDGRPSRVPGRLQERAVAHRRM